VCTHLTKRGSRYSIRRKVPVDLQSHYGRNEIVKALGTSDCREAEQLCRVAGAKLDEEFMSVRAALAASAPTQDTPATAPAPDTPIRINADEVAPRTLGLLRQRRDAAAAQGFDALTSFLEQQRANREDNEAVLRGELDALHPLSKHEGWRNALQAFLTGDGSVKELPEHFVHEQPAQAAQPVSLAQPAPLGSPTRPTPPAAIGGHTLQEIADKWVKERAPIKRTVGQAQKVIGRYMEHMGDTKVEQITRRNVVEFKDKLLESGQTPVNTNKQLMILSILLNFGIANSIIDQNPAKGVKAEVRKNAKEARPEHEHPEQRRSAGRRCARRGRQPKGKQIARSYRAGRFTA
jgi:hypothetical protein